MERKGFLDLEIRVCLMENANRIDCEWTEVLPPFEDFAFRNESTLESKNWINGEDTAEFRL